MFFACGIWCFSKLVFQSEIKNLMQERKHFHKKTTKTNKARDSLEQLQTVTKCSYSELRKEKRRYYSTRLSEDQNSKEMWKTLNKILPKNQKLRVKPRTCPLQNFISILQPWLAVCADILQTSHYQEYLHPELIENSFLKMRARRLSY